jgi:hypothetical protein
MEIDDKQAAESNTPKDESGEGPVTLEDRVEPGGEGSPGSNQASGQTEPGDKLASDAPTLEPLTPPDLDSMNVGGAEPQAPRHPDALRSEMSATGAYAHEPAGEQPTSLGGPGATPDENRPHVDGTANTGRAPGPEIPVKETSGVSHRVPGLDGQTPSGESVVTDTEAGAARMGPQALDSVGDPSPGQGDDQSVPSSGTSAMSGTSEEHQVVAGIKLPEGDDT